MSDFAETQSKQFRRFGDDALLATPSSGSPLRTILLATAAGLAVGAIYLGLTPRQYTAASKLIVGPSIASTAQTRPSDRPGPIGESLLMAQADVIRSSEVLRLAESAGSLNELATFRGDRDAVPTLRQNLGISVATDGGVITVTYAAQQTEDAAKIVNAVVDAYAKFVGQRRRDRATEMLAAADSVRAPIVAQLAEARRSLAAHIAASRAADNAEVARQRLRSLTDAATQQQLLAGEARRAYDAAVAEAGPQLAKLSDEELDRALLPPGEAGEALRSPERIAAELAAAAGRLAELKRTYADNHPSVALARTQIDRLRLERVVATRQAWRAYEARAESLRRDAERAGTEVVTIEAGDAELERLRSAVAQLETRLAAADRSADSARVGGAFSTIDIEVLTRAEADDPTRPVTPRPAPTLWLAVLAGFATGGMLAIAGEYRRAGTLRHVTTIRSDQAADASLARAGFGLRVLATLPEAKAAAQADPAVGVVLDAIDGTLAKAADAMPAELAAEGWTGGSLAVVSAEGGSGGSLVAFAVAAAFARAGRRTLLVEADARAARAGEAGFGDALASGSLATNARDTRLPGLKLVTFGEPRDSFSDLLNSPRLTDAIDAARSSFDAIVFDCPPLDAGDDGRVIGATTDAAIVVAEGNVSSLRRAAGVRDVLRLAGATVAGVVLNRAMPAGDPNAIAAAVIDAPRAS